MDVGLMSNILEESATQRASSLDSEGNRDREYDNLFFPLLVSIRHYNV